MSTFSDAMKKAKVAADKGGDFTELPVGNYIMKLTGCFRNKSQKGEGRNQTNLDWEVMEPVDKRGETHRSYHNLDHDVGLQIFVSDFAKMGIDVSVAESLEEIDPLLDQAVQLVPVFKIALVKKGDFLNTRMQELIGSAAETDTPAAAPAPSPDTVPEQSEVSLQIGNKIKYVVKDKLYTQAITAINKEADTIDTMFHKNVPLTDIQELLN
jgi:hypothetical protein